MSKIGSKIIEAEESDDKKLAYWREQTRRMHELQDEWDGMYNEMDGVIGQKQDKDMESDSPPF